ncbi:MAG: sodium:proton antiporter [Planctomycetota bacterium]
MPDVGLPPDQVLADLATVAALGLGAQWLAWRFRLPSILLLLGAGLLAGPVFGLLQPDHLFGHLLHPLVSLAVAVILYDGGLSLDLRELRNSARAIVRLCTVGVAVTWVLATALGIYVAGLTFPVALVLGAILTVTGPTVIGPLLRQVRPKGQVEPIARWEGIVADLIGATLAALALHGVLDAHTSNATTIETLQSALLGLTKTISVGALFGGLGAAVLAIPIARHWIPDALQNPISLAVVLVTFVGADQLAHESGLVAVTLMGFILANQHKTSVHHIVEFKENLTILLISGLFVILAATFDVDDLRAVGWGGLAFVLLTILVVRPVAVFVSTYGTGLARNERMFLAALAPRGIVAAAISALFGLRLEEAGIAGAEALAPMAFVVIIVTVAVYGLAAGPLARRLKLSDPDANGVLIAGAGLFSVAFAKALQRANIPVVLVDSNRAAVATARLEGLRSFRRSILEADVLEHLPMTGIGKLLAMTPNDEVNALACVHFAGTFGRANVYQMPPAQERSGAELRGDLRGRVLFRGVNSAGALDARVRRGAAIKATQLSSTFDLAAFKAQNGAGAVLLGRLIQGKRFELYSAERDAEAAPGDVLLSLVDPAPAEPVVAAAPAAQRGS